VLGYHESDLLSSEMYNELFDLDMKSYINKSIDEKMKTAFKAGIYNKNGEKQNAKGWISPLKEIAINTEPLYLCTFKVIDSEKASASVNEVKRDFAEQEKFADIIEATRTGTWEWDVEKEETKYNERWAEIVGYSLNELRPITHE